MKNLENIKLVLDKIETNPECWDQKSWHCGTSHCFGGWAQILSGKEADSGTVRRDARIFFGFNRREAEYYFDGNRTLEELKAALLDFYDQDGFDQDGFDQNGFNREGLDIGGYNRDGYNVQGYDRRGYDRDGYNFDGYNWQGYDRDGFDTDGLDRDNNLKPI